MSVDLNNLLSSCARKKIGRRCEYGRGMFGESFFGDTNLSIVFDDGNVLPISGIYQKRRQNNGKKSILLPYYLTPNPRTVPQQANRSKFGSSILAWQNLTDEQKEVYNTKARYKNVSGYNLFIKQYMLS